MWNKLSTEIEDAPSLAIFKKFAETIFEKSEFFYSIKLFLPFQPEFIVYLFSFIFVIEWYVDNLRFLDRAHCKTVFSCITECTLEYRIIVPPPAY